MAMTDGRGPPESGDTRENPTGETPETPDSGSGAPPVSPKRPPPPPRRTTGSIPVQGARKSTTSIPIVESDIVEEGPRKTGELAAQRELPVERPVSKSGAVPRRPSTQIPAQGAPARRPSSQMIPVQGGPERPVSNPARRPSQTAVPVAAEPATGRPNLLKAQTAPKLAAKTVDADEGDATAAGSKVVPTAADRPPVASTTADAPALQADESTDPEKKRPDATSMDQPALEVDESTNPDEKRPVATAMDQPALEVDESTDPERRRPQAATPTDFSSTEVRPALDPSLLEPPPTGLSAVPVAKPRAPNRDVPWEVVKDEPTSIGAMPVPRRKTPPAWEEVKDEPTSIGAMPVARTRSAPDAVEATATKPLPRLDTAAPAVPDLSDDDDEVPTSVLPRPDPALLEPRPKESGSELSEKPVKRRGGTYSRQRPDTADAGKPKAPAPLSELSQVIRMEAVKNAGGRVHGFQLAIGLVMMAVGAVAFLAFLIHHHDRPPLETLQVQYPYGFSGGRQPNGRAAPPVSQVLFDYEATIDCGEDVCLRYLAHSADDSFQLTMDLKKDGSEWKLVGGPSGPPQGMTP